MPNEQFFDLTIRAAEMNDAAALAQLMCELGYETTKSEMEMRLGRIATDEGNRTFVAVHNGKVCGMIGTFRVIQLMRRTHCLRLVIRCLVSVRDFDGPTDSQSLSIAET